MTMATEGQTELVFSAPIGQEEEVIKEIERMDENLIVETLKGRSMEKLFHEFPIRGTTVVQLSWAGVKYFTLQLKGLKVEEVKITETDEKYRAVAWAYDKVRDTRVMGAAEQSKTYKSKDGTTYPDEFALAKVVSKAQRNALKNLIPETMISQAYVLWKDKQAGVKKA